MAASTHLPILVNPAAAAQAGERGVSAASPQAPPRPLVHAFEDVYREQFPFVWRSAKRLGVRDAALDDVVQEVFVVVHRRLADFEGRSSLKTWLFGITLRVVRDHRRAVQRRDPGPPVDPDTLHASGGPAHDAEKAEAVRLLHAVLDDLHDERREVFVMAELEEMTMPEIAEALAINLNTAYARLRIARQEFEQSLARHRARDEWRLR
ncbi:MAG: sigma-70 family RNA polymerase sigma factor [Deltaproteobacteria bacterium]|nr:sigma-70 family RNA polymerase sigma factor [Deltaproteobacteria bacterium]